MNVREEKGCLILRQVSQDKRRISNTPLKVETKSHISSPSFGHTYRWSLCSVSEQKNEGEFLYPDVLSYYRLIRTRYITGKEVYIVI